VPDAIAYLRSLGVPIPETGNRGGTLTVRFSGLSAPSARAITVRTTTAVAGGRAGLAYPAVATRERLTDTDWICGLRQTGEDRSNVALVNMGGPDEGDVTLRLRIYSASSRGPVQTLPDETLPPGDWKQLDQLLAGKAITSGFVEVQRVSGSAPFYAYGIVNDQVNSDGSFVPPYRDTSRLGDGLTLPVVVETAAYSSEVVLTNTSSTARSVRLTYVDDALTTGDRKAVLVLPLAAFDSSRSSFPASSPTSGTTAWPASGRRDRPTRARSMRHRRPAASTALRSRRGPPRPEAAAATGSSTRRPRTVRRPPRWCGSTA
jgi:hypothetical protein